MQDDPTFMLPPEVVASILQHVPEQPRFSTCALVCRGWHNAALAATRSLIVHLPQQAQLHSLGLWLQQHGTALKVLSVSSESHHINARYNDVLLAIQQLQELECLSLKSLEVNVSAIASRPLGHYLSAVTSLELDEVHWQTDLCVELLPQLRGLRHMRVSGVRAEKDYEWYMDQLQRASENWTQLTSLVLDNPLSVTRDAVLKSLGKLTQLLRLQIRQPYLRTNTLSLPLSLTCLELVIYDDSGCHDLSARLFGKLCKLVQLQHLTFRDCRVESKSVVVGLLAALPQLKQLKHLSLRGSLCCFVDAKRYTAVVSSSQLTHLDVTDCCMPQNAVCHMFAAENQHSALHTFQIGKTRGNYLCPRWSICGGAFSPLVGCCPKLVVLHLGCVSQRDTICVNGMTVLEQLTTLRKLTFSGEWVFDVKVVQLANLKVPALRDLEITSSYPHIEPEWTASGVLSLRDMTQLTRLKLLQCREGYRVVGYDIDWCVEFVNQAGLSDLRERMYHGFKDNGNFAKVLLLEHKQDCAIAVRRAEAAEQKMKAAEQRAQAAQQMVEAAEKRAEAVELMIEAAEQRAEAAEQRAEAAEQRAEAAGQRAEAAEQRAGAAEQMAEAAQQQAEVAEQRARGVV